MYSISKKIALIQEARIARSFFSNEEIIPSAVTSFTCCACSHENPVTITPYESGFPIFQIYDEDRVLSKNELLKNKLTAETSGRMMHFGELTVNDLPTLYFGTQCSSCHSKYFCVFSYGEKQPGLTVLNISGIWKYEEVD